MNINPVNNQAFTGRYLIKLPKDDLGCAIDRFYREGDEESHIYPLTSEEILLLNGDDAKAYQKIYDNCVYNDADSEMLSKVRLL